MVLEQAFVSYISFVCAQIVFYEVSVKQAVRSYWFLGLFYFLVFSCLQGLVILCKLFSVSFLILPLLLIFNLFFLGDGLKRVPQFQENFQTLPNFCSFSSLCLSLIWVDSLLSQPFLTAKYNFLEAFVWSWFSAVLFPVLAGIKERLELMNTPPGFSPTGLFLVATGFILLALSFF